MQTVFICLLPDVSIAAEMPVLNRTGKVFRFYLSFRISVPYGACFRSYDRLRSKAKNVRDHKSRSGVPDQLLMAVAFLPGCLLKSLFAFSK